MAEHAWRFAGIRRPTYTQIPDDYLDEVMAHVSPIEWKVLCYIARRTFGFKKESDCISLHQICQGITRRDGTLLDHGTGLSKSSATKALTGLIDKGLIRRTPNESAEHGHVASTYHVIFTDDAVAQTLVHDAHKLVPGSALDGSRGGHALVHESAPQQTRNQQTTNRVRAHTARRIQRAPTNEEARTANARWGFCRACGCKPCCCG